MSWQDDLRALDTELARGAISAADYRQRRDEILGSATSSQAPVPTLQPGGAGDAQQQAWPPVSWDATATQAPPWTSGEWPESESGWAQPDSAELDDLESLESYAESASSKRTPEELEAELLAEVVEGALRLPEITTGLARAGLDSGVLVQAVHAERAAILGRAAAERDRLVQARTAVADAGTPRPGAVSNRTVSIGMIVLGLILLVPVWLATGLGDGMETIWRWLAWFVAAVSGLIGLILLIVAAMDLSGKLVPSTLPQRRAAEQVESARAEWLRTVLDDGVLPVMRRVLNAHLAPIRRTSLELTPESAPGLGGDRAASMAQVTGSVRRFQDAARRSRSGSIGLAGPRGVGKTTLIDFFAGRVGPETGPLKIVVSAPVQYEAREFVLHLFAKVCHAVIAREAERAALGEVRVSRGGRAGRFAILTVLSAALAVAAALPLVGPGGVFGKPMWDKIIANDLWLIPSAVFVLGALTALGMLLWTLAPSVGRGMVAAVRWLAGFGRANRDQPVALAARAREQLVQIRYLQTHTSGWSGKFTVGAAEGNWSKTAQLAEHPLTYPEIIDAFERFLAATVRAYPGDPAVVIAIDELDKIESAEAAQRFINEIKGIFAAPRTQFIVSVSSDALAAFERRGLPVRDAFDSAFQEIVPVNNLDLADTSLLLRSWVLGLPEPFVRLAHCLAGGLPRDVRRVARAMVSVAVDAAEPPLLDTVCARLVGDDMDRKAHAIQIALGQLDPEDDPTDFLRLIRTLRPTAASVLGVLTQLGQIRQADHSAAFVRLVRQTGTYLYHCATVLEVFTRETDERLENGPDDPAAKIASFELLATAKQSLAVHPRLAWVQIDEFREVWGLTQSRPL
ncbi:P-loop NTPase fold protein [Actinokineospora iranica]|uniref:KAP NTPase domain-containing protein n=1 Tax=Actinokineospora iranica TaxID=1271860 RepID=A0A1G6UQK7_9PSEU|nr:P-loop NTPase fold protein [Actinokineospora iranica]SDD42835.1 hypothetical protein SAMN05216174_11116 [Actinokineospora iranica]